MNIEHARTIPIRDILSKIGHEPVRNRGHDLFYLAPWRAERTASLHVHTAKNVWYDHGEGKGGSTIALVQRHLEASGERSTAADALRWLKNMTGYIPQVPPEHAPVFNEQDSALSVKKVRSITHPALIRYVEGRGITLPVAKGLLQEVRVLNKRSGKYLFALGMKNEDGGYELRNRYIKSCVRPKSITFVRGAIPKPDGIHLFEGVMDYLSVIAQRNGDILEDDAIILNSLSCMKDGSAYIKNYGYRIAYTWLDNDEPGRKATEAFAEFFKTEDGLQHAPMNALYAGHKDVNAAHMARLGLTLTP